jgi:RNA ligase (TIGR02306 family)
MTVATTGKVIEVNPIAGADRIHSATVVCGQNGKWMGVVGKDIDVGDMVVVFLQDAILPADPYAPWAFMEKHKWRVRMARFKGVPSECVILKLDGTFNGGDWVPGLDMAEALGVTKYHKPIPAAMQGKAKGNFPAFLPKTDEPNFQRVDFGMLMHECPWYMTEKADGTSCTAYMLDDGLHVCSRNLELLEFEGDRNYELRDAPDANQDATNVYWRTARKYKLHETLQPGEAVQFEIIGPNIQKNPHGLTEHEGRLFSYFKRNDETNHWDRLDPCLVEHRIGIPLAKPRGYGSTAMCADSLRKTAEITYENGEPGEGIVVRAVDQSWSFKVINLAYKGD